ncbi:sensor domain-containing diguanylate cyclase [Pseudogracilibacillus auburnensis]|uniref:sensor domain-containing diguanylate cyclase n=1 Tax=Pseudogracilibacillus auburnensis TaxID=1494959 RepID=UPI001A970B22|nr:sensor domain-containing diguanylate cyclase [Pseudogracilibacillus auburnensis]MBO1005592.1 diguanylate cyclase [Pseudogracilibacillus auburnensis]
MRFVWVLWFMVVPIGHWYAYQISPPVDIGIVEIILFATMACAIACLPLVINGTTLFLSHWVTVAAFLSYGLFFEMILLQMATVCVMIVIKLKKDELHRYFLNSTMLFITSLVSGIGFFAAGGTIGFSSLNQLIIPLIVYQFLYFITNQILLYYITKLMRKEADFFGKDFVWEALLLSVIFPLGIGAYYLSQYMGSISLLFIGIPFISFALVSKLYNSSEKVNDNLQKAAEIGHELTGRLDVKGVLDLFIKKISNILPVDYAYIMDIQHDRLIVLRQMEKGVQSTKEIPAMKKNEGISGRVWYQAEGVIFDQKSEWEKITLGYPPIDAESIMCVPIIRSESVEGVLLLASTQKNAYEKFQLMIVDILCSYFSVALLNARHYEKTKQMSEHCGLTKLYNYRYFERCLNDKFKELEAGMIHHLSLIMLDLDYFKQVNDTYGHQAGNEVLIKIAGRLKSLIGGRGIVSRYGGEEFAILLPNVNEKEALITAEQIRKSIANTPFTIQNELDPYHRYEEVQITASIGVSSAPTDAEDGLSLVKYADRALYIGAKRAGRNKVAEYVKA